MRRSHALLVVVAIAALTALAAARTGIGAAASSPRAAAPHAAASSPRAASPTPRAAAGPGRSPSGVVSADARLAAGRSATLVRVRGLGRFVAACSADGLVSVAFVADRLLPTSDLVVARTAGAPLARRLDPGERVAAEPPGAVLMERWQVAPFAAAQVQVSVANVAGRSLGDSCSASVLVTTGPDQGPTIT